MRPAFKLLLTAVFRYQSCLSFFLYPKAVLRRPKAQATCHGNRVAVFCSRQTSN